jgi:heat shock protein HslJ
MERTSPWLALAATFALIAGCATAPKEPPPKPFIGTQWQVVLELPLAGEQPNMRFGDGRVEGFGGCSKFSAPFVEDTVGARAIVIRKIFVDRRLCEPGPRAVEAHMLEVLQSVSSYSVTGSTMTMTGSGGTLLFHAVEAR